MVVGCYGVLWIWGLLIDCSFAFMVCGFVAVVAETLGAGFSF